MSCIARLPARNQLIKLTPIVLHKTVLSLPSNKELELALNFLKGLW